MAWGNSGGGYGGGPFGGGGGGFGGGGRIEFDRFNQPTSRKILWMTTRGDPSKQGNAGVARVTLGGQRYQIFVTRANKDRAWGWIKITKLNRRSGPGNVQM